MLMAASLALPMIWTQQTFDNSVQCRVSVGILYSGVCMLNTGVISMSGRSSEQESRPTADQDDTRVPTLKRDLKKGGTSRSAKPLSTAVKR